MDEMQKKLYKLAISDIKSGPPYITNDPIVNHAVDQFMQDDVVPYDKQLYLDEIAAFKQSGAKLLAFI